MRLYPALLLLVTLAAPAAAQTPSPQRSADPAAEARRHASPYLPLGHWAYDYVNLLIARGKVTDLPPLVQPYRRIDIAAALRKAVAEGRLSPVERAWAESVLTEMPYDTRLLEGTLSDELQVDAYLGLGLKALTHTHRDPLRPEGDEAFFPTIDAGLSGVAPGVAGAFRARWDNHYLNDPQFADERAVELRQCDPIVDECAYRVEEAYVELQFPWVRVFFGRTYRNWGLPGVKGMLLSDYAYSYDHVAYRFGSDRLALSGVFTLPNDFLGDTARYFASHRLDWRPRSNLVLSVGESVVYGGVNRRLDLAVTNPVGIWEISGSSGSGERNALGLVEVWWRPASNLVTYGAFVVDNTSVDDPGRSSGIPQYAAAAGAQMPALSERVGVRLDLSIVNSLAYRSRVDRFEYYMIEGLGLAQDRTDAVVIALQVDWLARPDLVLKPRLEMMWKGEDDLSDPWPADAFTGHDLLLVGTVETTLRPAVAGRWRVPYGDLVWDLGLNVVRNEGNTIRDWRIEPVGRLELSLKRDL